MIKLRSYATWTLGRTDNAIGFYTAKKEITHEGRVIPLAAVNRRILSHSKEFAPNVKILTESLSLSSPLSTSSK